VVKNYKRLRELWEEKISMAGEYSHCWKDYSEFASQINGDAENTLKDRR